MTENNSNDAVKTKALVAIRCITYNHEAYIRDALEGFIMQKTNFPFVAIVHDDASTDGTADIIREYAAKYPDIIKPIYETENQYSKHDGSLRRIMTAACEATGAKYIALCEGDDYWTDPLKLQKQVDFLESHPTFSLCFHNAHTKMLDGSINDTIYNISGTREYTSSEILKNWTIPTASVVYRSGAIDNDPIMSNPKFKFGDNVLFLTAAKHGKLYCMDEYMSVYRKNIGGVTISNGNISWNETLIEHFKTLDTVFGFMLDKNLCKDCISTKYIYLIRRSRNYPMDLFKYTLRAIKDCRWRFISMAINTWILHKQ